MRDATNYYYTSMPAPDAERNAPIDEPGLELVRAESSIPALIGPPGPAEWEALKEQARWLAASGLVKSVYRGKESNVMLMILQGRELAMPPVATLTNVHIIDGVPSLSAKMQMALVKRAGHFMRVTESTEDHATVVFGRRGEPREDRGTFTYTIQDAETAKLLKKDNWAQNPKAMLRARAITAVTTMEFTDVLMGVTYSPEELGADVDPMTGEVTGVPAEERITNDEARAFKARIDDVVRHDKPDVDPEKSWRHRIVTQMAEAGMVLGRNEGDRYVALLPKSRRDELDEIISGIEQWMPKDTPSSDDDDVAEGEFVGDPPASPPGTVTDDAAAGSMEPHPAPPGPVAAPSDDGVEDAELVPPDDHAVGATEAVAGDSDGIGEGPAAEPATAEAPPEAPQPKRTDAQRKRIMASATEAGLDTPKRHGVIRVVTQGRVESANDLTKLEADRVLAVLKGIIAGDLEWGPYTYDDDTTEETVLIISEKGKAMLGAIGLL